MNGLILNPQIPGSNVSSHEENKWSETLPQVCISAE